MRKNDGDFLSPSNEYGQFVHEIHISMLILLAWKKLRVQVISDTCLLDVLLSIRCLKFTLINRLDSVTRLIVMYSC